MRMTSVRSNRKRLLVNHMPGTLRLASKSHLPSFARLAGFEDSIPTTFVLPEELDQAHHALSEHGIRDSTGLPLWVLKSKQHRHVRALMNVSRAGLLANSPALLQRRVRPLILRGLGRAFDVGLYVLVSSVTPLRVYAYERALVRVCEAPFPNERTGFRNSASFVVDHYAPIWTLPFFQRLLQTCDASAACALRKALDADGHDGEGLWRGMHAIAGGLLSALQPAVEVGLRHLGLNGENAFELFRFDFLVDTRGQPVLTEVNISPNMVATHPEDRRVKAALLRDTLRIASEKMRRMAPMAGLEGQQDAREVMGGFMRLVPGSSPLSAATSQRSRDR